MLKLENAFLLDICLGYPFGELWFPGGLPEVKSEDIPQTFLMNGEQLTAVRELYQSSDPSVIYIVEGLRAKADVLLTMPEPSVTQKHSVPEGVELNDYYSLAKYWWPNPETEDGLPYIRRDGEVNPECYSVNSDLERLETFSESSFILAITAYITGEKSYAKKAEDLIHTWIVNPVTRQTPHFIHAQEVPGKKRGFRYQGLVESRRLIYVCEAVQILRQMNGGMETNTFEDCIQWFTDLLNWIESSEQGKKAINSKNNIGFWVDLQRLVYARFTNQKDLVEKVLIHSILPRMDKQIAEDGSLPEELLRAKPYDYVAFTLLAIAGLSAASKRSEIELAEYSTEEGRSFQNAFDWFNNAIQSNGLQEKSLALSQLVLKQQENFYLKLQNKQMEQRLQLAQEELQTYMEQQSTQFIGEQVQSNPTDKEEMKPIEVHHALRRVSNRNLQLEEENIRLRSDLQDQYRNVIHAAFQFRGHEFIIKESSKEILELYHLKDQLIEAEQNLSKLKHDLQQTIRLKEDLKQKLNQKELELKEAKLQSKSFENERNRANRRVRDIHTSRSWRYTEPVRKIARYIKRVALKQQAVSPAKKGLPKKENLGSRPKYTLTNKNKKDQRRVDQLRRKLLNLGFTERAYEDLESLYQRTPRTYLKKLAAMELSLWHASQYNQLDAQKSLKILRDTFHNEKDVEIRRQVAIMEAECLDILEEKDRAKKIVLDRIEGNPHADLFLAAVNLESMPEQKIMWINKALKIHGISSIQLDQATQDSLYDRLMPVQPVSKIQNSMNMPKVTVIMPVYNSEKSVSTALDSVIAQTWTNLEILVVDDCSKDETVSVIEEYAAKDDRIRLIKAQSNGGPYVARNLALQKATGEFVTCHDADDWSHPEKIETQVLHLMENPEVIGNTSEQARATSDLKFYRRGKFGSYIFSNMSSFMFRREPVFHKVGYWDSVRFGADSEYIRRITKVFGNRIVNLPTGPLSFQRQSEGSLTGNELFGYQGYFMGARKEYFESHNYHHENITDYYYDFPQETRPFAVPEPMKPNRKNLSERREFDVIIVSDFRLDGGSTISSLEEIKAQTRMGLKTGLIQMSRYDYNPMKKINSKIRDVIDGDHVQMIVYGEKVSCDTLILRYPPILQEKQRFIPDVEAKEVRVIINQPPMSDYSEEGKLRYELPRIQKHLIEYFGKPGVWHPIGPLIRDALHKYHADELPSIHLSEKDWENIIHVDEWKREPRQKHSRKPIIGRHSRDQDVKWPGDKKELLSIYPDSDEIEVHVLGGAETPRKIIGTIPNNWVVHEFGEMHPKEFLANLDIFVYYTHSDWVESFGRVIIEAMAVGVPVILPHHYNELFGDAAVYAAPSEVLDKIKELMEDSNFYDSQVKKAHDYVEKHFGYSMHAKRLQELFTPAVTS